MHRVLQVYTTAIIFIVVSITFLSCNYLTSTHDSKYGIALEKAIRTFGDESARVIPGAISADHKIYAVNCNDETIKLLSVDTGEEICTLERSENKFPISAFSTDNKIFVANGKRRYSESGRSYYYNNKIWFWSVETGKLLHRIRGYSENPGKIVFSGNGKIFAYCENWPGRRRDSRKDIYIIKIFSAETGALLRTIRDDEHSAKEKGQYSRLLAISDDGKTIATGNGKEISLWSVETGEQLFLFQDSSEHRINVTSLAFSPDSKILAFGDSREKITMISAINGETLQVFSREILAFSPNGKVLASAGSKGVIELWSVKYGHSIRQIKGHRSKLSSVSFSPDGRHLTSCDAEGIMKLWKVDTENIHPPEDESAENEPLFSEWQLLKDGSLYSIYNLKSSSVNFSPDGKLFATKKFNSSSVLIWNALSGEFLYSLTSCKGKVDSFSFSPVGNLITIADSEKFTIYSTKTGKEVQRFNYPHHSSHLPTAIDYSPDGRYFVSDVPGDGVSIRSAKTGNQIRKIDIRAAGYPSIKYSPDGMTLASAGNVSLVLSSAVTGKEIQKIRDYYGHLSNTINFDFSPDGRFIALMCHENIIKLVPIDSSEEEIQIKMEVPIVSPIRFNPDGESVYVCDSKFRIHQVSVPSGEILQTYKGHKDRISSVDVSPDGKLLVSTSYDSTVKIWATNPKDKPSHVDYTQDSESFDLSAIEPSDSFNGWSYETDSPSLINQKAFAQASLPVFSPDGIYIAINTSSNIITLLSSDNLEYLRYYNVDIRYIKSLDFSPDGKTLYASDRKRHIAAVSVETGETTREYKFEHYSHSLGKVNYEKNYFVTFNMDKIELWSLEDENLIGSIEVKDKNVWLQAISPNGEYLITKAGQRPGKVWLIDNGKFTELWDLPSVRAGKFNVAFSPDNGQIAFSDDSKLVLYSAKTGKVIKSIKSQKTAFNLVFSPDGKLLASTNEDYDIVLHSVETGELVQIMKGHMREDISLAFSPDCTKLISCYNDRTVKMWAVEGSN